MSKFDKLIWKLLTANADNNFDFADLVYILRYFNFESRIYGSHHIFWKSGIDEIINIQPLGSKAKPYQVKQVRNVIVKYKLITNEI